MDRFDRDESPMRDNSDEGAYDHNQDREHRSKDRNQSRSRGDDREHRNTDRKDLEKDRKERRKEDRDDRDKDRSKEKHRDRDKDRKEKEPERDREIEKERGKDKTRDRETEKERGKDKTRDRETEKERGKDKIRDRERERERDKTKDKEREKGKEKHKDREKERESEKDRDREKAREKSRDQGREMDIDKERSREREKVSKKAHEDNHVDTEDNNDRGINKQGKVSYNDKDDQDNGDALTTTHVSSSNLSDRIMKMKEERLKQKSEGVPEVLAWINRSRKLEEKKIIEKKKALQFSKMFKEQDNIVQGESEDEEEGKHINHNLAGVKVLHGLDKVMEGGAVVLTLKDQHILSGGDLNEDVDMLENTEIGEQKRRDEAYKAAKKKTGIYADKFSDDPSSERTILPQYDDPVAEEGLALDARGRFNVEAEKKLEELRRRIQGGAANYRTEDLTLSAKTTSDYYTQEEMMIRFNKPKKKKKSLRKKDKLDLDALEAEAVSTGLGAGDLGSRKDGRRQAMKEEQERHDAEMKSEAYKEAYAKADEAIKSLRMEGTLPVKLDTEEPFADDEDDFYKSLERTRKLALKKQQEAPSGPEAIARLAASQTANEQNPPHEESEEKKVVITEMQEFVWGLPLGEEVQKQDHKDVFLDEDEGPVTSDHEMKDEPSGWTEVKDNDAEENSAKEDKEDIVPDETIHEPAVGKGLSGALHLLKGRGTLKEGIEWGGRNMDKKKSKLVGIVDDNAVNPVNNDNRFKDIRIERTDEFGRIMTPKEAFRMISHKFHGKGPGKMKQEKRMKQYQEELKLKQMKNSDTPTESVERMREAQARLKTPYLVLSGHVKPGQTSDPKSGFATVEKDLSGGLTPLLGNRKVEQFLGIKRKGETDNTDSPKKPKT